MQSQEEAETLIGKVNIVKARLGMYTSCEADQTSENWEDTALQSDAGFRPIVDDRQMEVVEHLK